MLYSILYNRGNATNRFSLQQDETALRDLGVRYLFHSSHFSLARAGSALHTCVFVTRRVQSDSACLLAVSSTGQSHWRINDACAGIGVFVVAALAFFGCRHWCFCGRGIGVFGCRHWCFCGRGTGVFVVVALVFLWSRHWGA